MEATVGPTNSGVIQGNTCCDKSATQGSVNRIAYNCCYTQYNYAWRCLLKNRDKWSWEIGRSPLDPQSYPFEVWLGAEQLSTVDR